MSCPPQPPPRTVELHALGARLRVDLGAAPTALVDSFRRVWRRCLTPPPWGGDEVDAGVLHVDSAVGGAGGPASVEGVLTWTTQQVTAALITAQAGRLLMFHAGALSSPETGATLVYVAPGGTGKTTLSRTLGRQFAYLTDETVGITEDQHVLPYPKPLTLRRPGAGRVKFENSPDDLEMREPVARPWVAGVVILRRDPEHHGVSVQPLDVADALLRLAPETSSLTRLQRPLHRLADLGAGTGGFRLVRYAEAADLADLVHETVGATR